jgi:hypothetical protein
VQQISQRFDQENNEPALLDRLEVEADHILKRLKEFQTPPLIAHRARQQWKSASPIRTAPIQSTQRKSRERWNGFLQRMGWFENRKAMNIKFMRENLSLRET